MSTFTDGGREVVDRAEAEAVKLRRDLESDVRGAEAAFADVEHMSTGSRLPVLVLALVAAVVSLALIAHFVW